MDKLIAAYVGFCLVDGEVRQAMEKIIGTFGVEQLTKACVVARVSDPSLEWKLLALKQDQEDTY